MVRLLFILLVLALNSLVTAQECQVTETVTLNDCILYCWKKYDGKKDFYDFESGKCKEQVTCGKGYYREYAKNICIDEFGGYILRDLGYVIKVKEESIVKFVKIIILEGYTVGNQLKCKDGWKSSSTYFLLYKVRTEKKSDISIIVYLCDEELKEGEIYPKTHGEYFFEKLTLFEKNLAMDSVLGADSLGNFFTLKVNIFLVFSAVYLFLNIAACFCGRKTRGFSSSKSSCCMSENKEKPENIKLTESESKEMEEFLEKRKEENMEKLKNLKCFSLKDEINQQLEVIKNIKLEKREKEKKRWWKKYQEKEKEKEKAKTENQSIKASKLTTNK